MKKTISFGLDSSVKDVATIPKPTKSYLPNWYKDMDLLGTLPDMPKSYRHISPKACAPFRDIFLSGYTFELWTDIEIIKEQDGTVRFFWAQSSIDNLIDIRSMKELYDIPTRPGYFSPVFSIFNPLFIKTPPGYSVLITSPMNTLDTKLEIMSGIVDTDKYPMYPGRVPFIFPVDFTGVVKAGTPLMQIIPFKRDSWDAIEDDSIIDIGNKAKKKFNSVFFGGYRNSAWAKKDFS